MFRSDSMTKAFEFLRVRCFSSCAEMGVVMAGHTRTVSRDLERTYPKSCVVFLRSKRAGRVVVVAEAVDCAEAVVARSRER